jgi:uncharacterized membrane protein YfcA
LEVAEIVAIALTLGGGSLLQSSVGFGFGLFVVPLLLLITNLTLYNTIGLMAAAGLIQSVVSVYHLRRHVDWKALLPLMIVGIIGLQMGVWLQGAIAGMDKTTIRQIVGAIQLATLLAFLLLKVEPRDRIHVLWGLAALFLGGLISGCAGMGGPFIVLWAVAQRWSNFKARATILALIASMVPFQIGFLIWQFGSQVWHFALIGFLYVPVVLAGTAGGLWIGGRIPTKQLRQLMIGILFLIATLSVLQPWLRFSG